MIDDHDLLLTRVLESAKAGAAPPEAAALARVFAGVEHQLRAASSVAGPRDVARSSELQLPPPAASSGAARHWAVARWVAWGTATGVAGFLLGVQYTRPAPSPAPTTGAVTSPPTVPALLPAPPPVPAQRSLELVERSIVSAPDIPPNRTNRASARPTRDRVDHAAPSTSYDPLGFDAVLERLARAQRAERDGLAGDALTLLDEIDRLAEPSLLREERLVTRVLVACDLRDGEGAKRAARALGDGPSIYASRLAESCVGEGFGAPQSSRTTP